MVRLMLGAMLAAILALAAAAQERRATDAPRPAEAAQPLAGLLADGGLWRAWAARFVTEDGRVVDTANGRISHSEGQGYGLLLAVAANDRPVFERLWAWTRANLMVRPDGLIAWRWEPARRPAVADLNNATDGDLLVAWALTEAAEAWGDPAHRVAARRLATEIGRRLVLFRSGGAPLILPGAAGFSAEERPDGPVVNLSYWVFPAFPRLAKAAPEFDWDRVSRAGLDLAEAARFGPRNLPTEWIAMRDGRPRPAEGQPARFSYNAIRVPLYLIWAGLGTPERLAPYAALWAGRERAGLPVVDTADGRTVEWMDEGGYAALPALVACATSGTPLPAGLAEPRRTENYYPTTLHLLAVAAARARHPACLPG